MTRSRAFAFAGKPHVRVLAAIHAASFQASEAWGADAIELQLALTGVFALLHQDGGMVICRAVAGEAEILTLAVMPEARQRGIGVALLRAAMREAAARGASVMFLEVSTKNRPALTLYGRAGFRDMGRRSRYYSDGVDAVVMRASLQNYV